MYSVKRMPDEWKWSPPWWCQQPFVHAARVSIASADFADLASWADDDQSVDSIAPNL
jgi:hypothetical protein